MLVSGKTVAFVPSRDLAGAEQFYVEVLGLAKLSGGPYGLVLEANGVTVRIARTESLEPQPFTILGFDVTDVEQTARALAAQGVTFQRYPSMKQDELGIWSSPGGSRIAWFKDPDGNTLSVAQHPG